MTELKQEDMPMVYLLMLLIINWPARSYSFIRLYFLSVSISKSWGKACAVFPLIPTIVSAPTIALNSPILPTNGTPKSLALGFYP